MRGRKSLLKLPRPSLGVGQREANSGRALPVIRVVLQQEVGELTGIV